MYAETVFDREQFVGNYSGFALKTEQKESAVKRTAFVVLTALQLWLVQSLVHL